MKTKKPSKKRKARRRRYAPQVSLARRKEVLASVLATMVENTSAKQRLAIAQHITNCGLALQGEELGIDTTHAMVMFPGDREIDLIQAAVACADRTDQPFEDVVDGVVEHLSRDLQRTPAHQLN